MAMNPIFVGIDVSKAHLDIATSAGEAWRSENGPAAIDGITARIAALGPALVVLEATGRYEAACVAALATAGVPVAVVNPRQVRDFAKSTGRLAKTDAIDAAVLALFAERVRPAPRALPDAESEALARHRVPPPPAPPDAGGREEPGAHGRPRRGQGPGQARPVA